MQSYKLPITALLLGIFVLSVSNLFALEHFDPVARTINSMSILVTSATLDDEDLIPSDEIGAFTADPLCVGANVVSRAGAQLSVACWPDDNYNDNEKNGFYEEDEIFLRVWDSQADQEWNVLVEDIEILNEAPLLFFSNGMLRCNIATIRREEPGIEVAPNAVNFGNIWEDGEDDSGVATFEIRSTGIVALVVQPLEIENDAFSTDFGDEAVSIDPDELVEVTVTFAPTEPGVYEGSITISHNVENTDAVVVSLWGELREPSARIGLNAASHDFGVVSVDGNPRNWQLFISNPGEADLVVNDITVGDDQFATNFEGEITIEPEGRYLIAVTFDPDDVGYFETDLEISSNATNSEDGVCHLMGECIAAGDPVISFPDGDLDFDADPPQPQHFFGIVDVNNTEHWRMTILNTGGSDLWIYDVTSDNETFVTDWNSDGVRLRPNDHYYIDVAFTPDDEAFYNGSLQITSNDPSVEETTVVLVRGLGTVNAWDGRHFRYFGTNANASHIIGVNEATLDNNDLVPGDEIGIFTPSGFCAGAGVIPEQGITGFTAWCDDQADDGIINGFRADEALAFKVWDADAEIEAWATPDYIDGPEIFTANGQTRLNLTAGMPEAEPDIELSAGLFHFGQVDYDDQGTKDWTFTIFNQGEGRLEVNSIDSDMNQFTVDFEGAEIGSHAQMDVTVTFAPDAEGFFVGRLTINSNDPVDPIIYIDVDGHGVEEVVVPTIELPGFGYFFGVQHINEGPWEGGPYSLTLGISNTSRGGVLIVSDVRLELDGNEAFDTDWDGREFEVPPGETVDLGITFYPDQVRRYDGTLFITSNDENNGEVQFLLRGWGSDADDYFLHFPTATRHTLNLDRAYLWMDTNENNELDEEDWTGDLIPGDEVAVFEGDLCVGHLILDGNNMTFTANADVPATPYLDGFVANHEMTFRFWDWTAGEELICDMPAFSDGNEVFAANGVSDLSVGAQIMSRERQISYDILPFNDDAEDPDHWEWGPVAVNESVDHTILIFNSGDHDLTISSVEVPAVLATDFGDEDVVLGGGESLELTVTFTPAAHLAYNNRQIIIHSDDPDEPAFAIYMTGMGSIAEGYFEFYRSDASHSIVVSEFTMGGAAPGIGDEIAVFVPEGFFPGVPAFCAGKRIITDPNPNLQRSIAAWANLSARPDWLLEGFNRNDVISFKVWDASQDNLYEGDGIDVAIVGDGSLIWTNSVTGVTIDVPGVFSLGYDPNPVEPVDEGEVVEFTLILNNPPVDNMVFEMVDAGGAGGELNGDSFSWQTEPGDAGVYYPRFTATDPNDEDVWDEVTVPVEVVNINFDPVLDVDPAQFFEWDDELGWTFHINEDNLDANGDVQQWITVIPDLNEFFRDPDGDNMIFYSRPDEPDGRIQHDVINDESYVIRVYLENRNLDNVNWSGVVDTPCEIVALDLPDDERDSYARTLRMINGGISNDNSDRSLRSIGNINNTQASGPRRDDEFPFEFTLIVDPVNDLPVASAEAGGAWRFSEGQEASYNVSATDIEDAAAELTWTAIQIPAGSAFNDNGDGSGTFTWTPGFDAAGNYTAIFDVEDTDGGVTRLTINNTITVGDVNRPPVLTGDPLPDVNRDEDCGPQQIVADLFAAFSDADNDEIRFTVTCAVAQLGVTYADGVININPVANWNGEADVVVTARDFLNNQAHGGMFEDTFHVTVTSVNDAPGAFTLTTPATNYRFIDGMETIDFAWTEAVQVPFEGDDMVLYAFIAKVQSMPNDSVVVPNLDATSYNDVNVREVLAGLGIEETDFQIHERVIWYVIAYDTENLTIAASNAPFIIEIILAVDDPEASLIPEDYYLSPNFPNPFNASTTVQFGLPTPGDVQVMVWDMHGRQVANLATGYHAAGRFEVVWDAGQIPTGVYVISLSSGNTQIMQKAILLK
jgi:hypothetical protein